MSGNGNDVILDVTNLKKWFPLRRGLKELVRREPRKYVKAVDGISFQIKKGEIFALAGESGCGKSTTGRTVLRLLEPTDGIVRFMGRDIMALDQNEIKTFLRRKAQIIFQDPYESLSPRMTVEDIIGEPLEVHRLIDSKEERKEIVSKYLEEVGLTPAKDFIFRYPHELSGGQRQRVAVARALVLEPEFIVADEPVSMLDMSIRASILNLLLDLREKRGLSFLFITHDLSVAKYIADRLAIMYLGKIVELGKATDVIDNPQHPYTKALISAVPVPDPRHKIGEIPIKGEVPSPINIPPGCRFHPRCLYAFEPCDKEKPGLKEVEPGHFVACHLYDRIE